MGWKQNKMAAKGESSADSTPSTYSPLSRKWGYQTGGYTTTPGDAASGHPGHSGQAALGRSQYDAMPVGTLGTYDPAADEIDYSFYQNARPNRRRLLYSRLAPDQDGEEERAGGGGGMGEGPGSGGGVGRRKHRGRRGDVALRGRGGIGVPGECGGEGGDGAGGEEAGLDDAELSTETLYVMLLVLASTAVTMLAAYLILL